VIRHGGASTVGEHSWRLDERVAEECPQLGVPGLFVQRQKRPEALRVFLGEGLPRLVRGREIVIPNEMAGERRRLSKVAL
jgi:hypothetical protein